MIKNGENIALSGFTPSGAAKAVTKELAHIAAAEHEAGREFKVGIFTGASTGQSTDGDLSNAQAIRYRAPYTTNGDFRRHVNAGEIAYNDIHLSQMAQEAPRPPGWPSASYWSTTRSTAWAPSCCTTSTSCKTRPTASPYRLRK